MRSLMALTTLALCAAMPAQGSGQTTHTAPVTRDQAIVTPKHFDPVIKEMEDRNDAAEKAADAATAAIQDRQESAKNAAKDDETVIRFDMSGIAKPSSPDVFTSAFHFPPVAQYLTGTCWSFSTTSFYESEVFRLTGRKVKLSELWTPYWEYVEKMRRFVRERGDSYVAEGSEANAVGRIWKQYGVVPLDAYPGVLAADGRHDHSHLIAQLEELCEMVKENDLWDEELVLGMVRVILDRHLGPPPQTVTFEGASYTPREFLAQVLQLDLDAYVEMMSTLSVPFYTQGEFKVPDNWWHDASYHNVPLDEWYAGIKRAVQAGATVAIGGDVSEPGYNGFEDAAVVPSFDIPQEYIDQSSRELRFANHATEDDHGIHLVGYAQVGGRDWFLIKDSARSSRWGKYEGYYFYRDDYIRLKMLTYTVHRQFVEEILAKFPQ